MSDKLNVSIVSAKIKLHADRIWHRCIDGIRTYPQSSCIVCPKDHPLSDFDVFDELKKLCHAKPSDDPEIKQIHKYITSLVNQLESEETYEAFRRSVFGLDRN